MDRRKIARAALRATWGTAALVCAACEDDGPQEPGAPHEPGAVHAAALESVQVLPYTSQAPLPNGAFDFPYTVSTTYEIDHSLLANAPSSSSDLSARFRTLWDAENLYVFVQSQDDLTVRVPTGFAWESDSVEIYIDADGSAGTSYDGVDDFQLVLTVGMPGSAVTGVRSAPYPGGLTYYPIYPYRGNSRYYELRVAIPWRSLGVTPRAGARIGLDVHVNDNDGGEQRAHKLAAFDTVDDAWTNPSALQPFVLGPVQPLPPHVEQAVGNPTIDGIAQPGEWAHSDAYPIARPLVGSPTPGLSATYRALFTASSLALFVSVTDPRIVRDSPYPWEDDAVELFLDTGSGSYDAWARQFVFRPGDPTVHRGVNTPDDPSPIAHASQVVPGGYTMEISVPWSRLGLFGGIFGYAFPNGPYVLLNPLRLDVQVDDDRDGAGRDAKLAAFGTVDDGWTNPGRFGSVPLVIRP